MYAKLRKYISQVYVIFWQERTKITEFFRPKILKNTKNFTKRKLQCLDGHFDLWEVRTCSMKQNYELCSIHPLKTHKEFEVNIYLFTWLHIFYSCICTYVLLLCPVFIAAAKFNFEKKLFIHLRLFYNFGRVTGTVVFGNILHNVPLYLLCNATISIHKFQHKKASLINILIWLVLMKSSLSKIW